MSIRPVPSETQATDRTLVVGLLLGLLIAFGFALVISLIPAWVLTETGPRIVLLVLVALSSPVIVLPLRAVARRFSLDPRSLAWAAIGGSLLFDGTALTFVPGLYGQTGDAWAYTAAMLLWAFGWLAVTELLVERAKRRQA